MSKTPSIKNDPRAAIWQHLKSSRFVMLGSPESTQHMQPMSPQVEADTQTIWFYADSSSDLVKAVRRADPKHLVHMSYADSEFQMCMQGSLSEHLDPVKIDQHWSPVIAAWFKEGKNDPKLTMLCFTPYDASLWESDTNPIKFAFEITRGAVSAHEPDLGKRASVSF